MDFLLRLWANINYCFVVVSFRCSFPMRFSVVRTNRNRSSIPLCFHGGASFLDAGAARFWVERCPIDHSETWCFKLACWSQYGGYLGEGHEFWQHNAAQSARVSSEIQAGKEKANKIRSRGLNLGQQLSCAPEVDVLPTAPRVWKRALVPGAPASEWSVKIPGF